MANEPISPPESHVKRRRLLRRIGLVMGSLGLMLMVLGTGSFILTVARGISDPSGVSFPVLFPLAFVGMPVLFVGVVCLGYGYSGAVAQYMVREQAPAAAEGINRIVPATLGSLKSAASVLGVVETAERCSACGETAEADARFCDHCGAVRAVQCPKCNEPQNPDARFCDSCGSSMDQPS